MAEKKMEDLPPSYSNLGYDSEPVSGPSAPSFHEGPKFEGDFRESTAPPSAPPPEPEPGPRPLAYNPPNLAFENVFEACVRYADEHCCYSKRFLNQMKLSDVINKAVFYYKLESFGEKRKSETKSSPYKSGPIDGRQNGEPPDPWNITVLPPDLFEDCNVTRTIPHTDVLRICPNCSGAGEVNCNSCNGRGRIICATCDGKGTRTFKFIDPCVDCNGSGDNMCWSCIGTGTNTCTHCHGQGKTKYWKVLNVTWKNHVDEFFTDAGYLPNELIREAKGVELLKKKDLSIEPITDAPEAEINRASASLLETHKNAFPNEMIIRQRHILRAIPWTRVAYQWKQKDGEFYVYGTDRTVYFEDYPQRCCGCTCS